MQTNSDQVWKSLAAEATQSRGVRTRNLRPEEKQWLSRTLRSIHDAHKRNDVNAARTASHNIVASGYRRAGSPEAWENSTTQMTMDAFGNINGNFVNDQNRMLQNLHYQNQIALQQQLIDQMNAMMPGMSFGSMTLSPTVAEAPTPVVRDSSRKRRAPIVEAMRSRALSTGTTRDIPALSPQVSFRRYTNFEKPRLTREAPGSYVTRQNSADNSQTVSRVVTRQPSFARCDSSGDMSGMSVPPIGENSASSYDGFTVGDQVIRKGKKCTLFDIDFTTTPPDAIILQDDTGRKITTEFDQLEKPEPEVVASKSYQGFITGDKVIRKGQICTLTDIDFSLDPPGAVVVTEKGTEVSTEFTFLSKHEE